MGPQRQSLTKLGAVFFKNSYDPMFWVTWKNFTQNYHTDFRTNGSLSYTLSWISKMGRDQIGNSRNGLGPNWKLPKWTGAKLEIPEMDQGQNGNPPYGPSLFRELRFWSISIINCSWNKPMPLLKDLLKYCTDPMLSSQQAKSIKPLKENYMFTN